MHWDSDTQDPAPDLGLCLPPGRNQVRITEGSGEGMLCREQEHCCVCSSSPSACVVFPSESTEPQGVPSPPHSTFSPPLFTCCCLVAKPCLNFVTPCQKLIGRLRCGGEVGPRGPRSRHGKVGSSQDGTVAHLTRGALVGEGALPLGRCVPIARCQCWPSPSPDTHLCVSSSSLLPATCPLLWPWPILECSRMFP